MTDRTHRYAARVVWEGNTGDGTRSYTAYSRRYRVQLHDKPDIDGSADVAFRGEGNRHNPEELFIAAISSCHMLFYLALCARHGVIVTAYEDEVSTTLTVSANGSGSFEAVALRPRVVVAREKDIALAIALHARAHEECFIARACRVQIAVAAEVCVAHETHEQQ